MRRADPALWLLRAVVALFILFMLAPILVVVALSFTSAGYVVFPLPGLSLRWFARMLDYAPFLQGLRVSLQVALGATLLSVLLGVPASLALARSHHPAALAAMTFLLSPLSMPMIVFGFAALFFLSRIGLGLSLPALLVAHGCVCLPYVVRVTAAAYRGLPPALEEAAEVLGASRAAVLRHVVLPLLRPAIAAGSLFSFLVSFDNLPLSFFFGSPGTNTLPVVMLSYVEQQFDPAIAAISTAQLAVAVLLLVLADRFYGLGRLVGQEGGG
ncbi:ABC transporter permease [Roseomonas sp. GC11]|uniref:ABC transporter permease n=1 Tax=Roseomonas sp. GC11 TaxID=2950546 RepID=UPI00210C3967|nr:ABC transporter permease [Roseomonas sp. GC11]MCQ4160323.1 ABC transporter permease [Roseomonas sp. GC11]